MIHNKTATIDGEWLTIGTANIDRMSMTGNYEVNVEIFDATLARSLEETFRRDCLQARQLTLADWSRRAAPRRVLDRIVAPLRYLL